MRKALLIIAIVVLALVPFAAYMLIVNTPARVAVSTDTQTATTAGQELTEQQQADLQESHQKMIDLRKESIQKMVQDGLLTQAEGQQALEQLDRMAAYFAESGSTFGFGRMGGCFGSLDAEDGYYGRDRMRGYR